MATVGAVGQVPFGPVGLPAFIGPAKQNRFVADLGRFWGWATISPWRVKIRHTVDRDGTA